MSAFIDKFVNFFRDHLVGRYSSLLGEIRHEWVGSDPNSKSLRIAVYVNYDKYGVIHQFVGDQIRSLAEAGFRVIFVNHSAQISDLQSILPNCTRIFHRRNIGHDFGAYRFALRWIRNANIQPKSVILMNDSCYGFFSGIKEIHSNVEEGRADLWGITESFEHAYHIQSYFLLLSERLISSPIFWRFWDTLPSHSNRREVIRYGEIGLTQYVLRNGFRTNVLASYSHLVENWLSMRGRRLRKSKSEANFSEFVEGHVLTSQPINPCHVFWEGLLEDFQAPLIKRDLFSKNPLRVPNLHKTERILAKRGCSFRTSREHLRFATKELRLK